jgi:hypothetical protein
MAVAIAAPLPGNRDHSRPATICKPQGKNMQTMCRPKITSRSLLAATMLAIFYLSLSPASAGPVASLSRTRIDYGNFPPNVPSEIEPIFVTNVGDASLTISGTSIAGANASDFQVAGTCAPPLTLPPNARCQLDFTARAPTGGSGFHLDSATFTLQSDSTPAAADIPLTILIDHTGKFLPAVPSPAWIDFPGQPLATISDSQTMTILNPGLTTLAIVSLGVVGGNSDDFTVSSTCVPGGKFQPGQSCAATISFQPTANGPRSTELRFVLAALGMQGQQSFSVTGVGGSEGPAPGVSVNQHGLTGSWYEPATSGQGLELEVFSDLTSPGTGLAQLSWFTYDTAAGGADHQRWYTLGGPVVTGQPNAALTIYQNVAGNFNALPITDSVTVGTATLSFATCTSGQLAYNFADGRTGNIPLTRLTQNVTCSTTTPHPTNPDFALSGNWYDPATSGQGFTVEVNPISGALFAAWYTYAPMGAAAGATGQRWYTAEGIAAFLPGERSIPVTLFETTGGIFDMPTQPGQLTVAAGTGTLTFQSCTAATFNYHFTAGSSNGMTGTVNLSRIGPAPPGCA